jgi:zinc transporter ZupT
MVLGVANSFAGGVFMAIAFMHILPEEVGIYKEITDAEEIERPFPIPYLLYFVGYTFILIVDRVVFDSHALFEDDHHGGHGHEEEVADPAE